MLGIYAKQTEASTLRNHKSLLHFDVMWNEFNNTNPASSWIAGMSAPRHRTGDSLSNILGLAHWVDGLSSKRAHPIESHSLLAHASRILDTKKKSKELLVLERTLAPSTALNLLLDRTWTVFHFFPNLLLRMLNASDHERNGDHDFSLRINEHSS